MEKQHVPFYDTHTQLPWLIRDSYYVVHVTANHSRFTMWSVANPLDLE